MLPHQHLCELTNELTDLALPTNATPKGQQLLQLLQTRIQALLNPPPIVLEQRMDNDAIACKEEQRVIDYTPILTIPRITEVPAIMQSRNPTAKGTLKNTPRLHRRITRNNIPGIIPVPTLLPTIPPATQPIAMDHPLLLRARSRIVTRHAINALTATKLGSCHDIFTPNCLSVTPKVTLSVWPEHFACPMVHPVTGETISSYEKLMNDPAMTETWQTVFGKDFGGILQGDNKTGQKGMNTMFVMSHNKIRHVLDTGHKFTYGNPVVDYRPQKEDPHRIRITAEGNLITYASSPSIQTVDLDMAKLHCNSVISTKGAKYMCLDVKLFYLTAKLEYFEYMRMPLELFLIWIQEQCNLKMLPYKGFMHLEMQRAVWGLPQAGILANKQLRHKLTPFGYYEHICTPGLWYHKTRPILFTLVVNNFGVKHVNKEDIEHLIASIKKTYTLTKDWTGNLYCGIPLDWDYKNQMVDITMPGYVKKKLQEYHHITSKCIPTCPYTPAPKQFSSEAQSPFPPDLWQKSDKAGIKKVQKSCR
jgi:hypothetical protein